MGSLRLTVELTQEDWWAYQHVAGRRLARHRSNFATSIVITAAILLSAAIIPPQAVLGAWLKMVTLASIWAAALYVLRRLQYRAHLPSKGGLFFGAGSFEFDSTGIRTEKAGVAASYAWGTCAAIDRQSDTLYIWVDSLAAIVVPLRSLPEDVTAEAAENLIRALHKNGSRRTDSAPAAAVPSLQADSLRLFDKIIDTLRLWVLRPSRDTAKIASDTWIGTLTVLTLGLWIVLDRVTAGPHANWMGWNLPTLAACLLLGLAAAFIAARTAVPRIPFRITLYWVAAVAPIFVIVVWLADLRGRGAYLLLASLLVIYSVVYLALNLRRFTGAWQVRTISILLMIFAITYVADQETYWSASVWAPPPDNQEEYLHSAEKTESLLFDQRSKIDAVVQSFDRAPDGKSRIFFIGFAGVAEQRVFAEEIKLGANVVAGRFNVKNRQLLLLNDRRDLNSYPIGTVTSLSYALKVIGQKMNPDRDVLFLALSSHGSAVPSISVSNNPLNLQQLTGENLSAALKASGIKRRIILISACHAAAFIPALKSPDSIIITAAAADKTSFGCSDDRDLTYFGEAFYRDALPKAQSLQDAFDQAKKAITEREAQEGQKPSDPQAYFGTDLEQLLDANPMTPPGAH